MSIVIPVYNVERYLAQCFATVITQTYKNIEVLLIDDGSTDTSGNISDKLAQSDSRVSVIHKKNGGLSDARNTGIRSAAGDYITFIDSDDYVDASFVEIMLESAQRTGADISQCNNSRKSNQLGLGSNAEKSMRGTDAFVMLMKYKAISPTVWAKIYKLSLFRDNNIEFPVGRLHEDTAVLYKLIYFANRIVCLNNVLYYYRLNNMSIMNASYTEHHYGSVVHYHKELDEFISNNKVIISRRAIYRHKALRFLSVLNKMALHHKEGLKAYKNLKDEYISLAVKSSSLVCLLGIFPAYIPVIFRMIRNTTPVIRNVLGKT